MSAIFNNTVTKYLSASGLTGLSTNGRILICAWFTWDNTTPNSVNYIANLSQASGDGTPSLGLAFGSTPTFNAFTDASSANFAGTLSANTWYHGAVAYGEWDNTSNSRRWWRNGSLSSDNYTSNQPSIDLAYLAIGRRYDAAAAHKGRVAQVGIWAGLTTGQEDTVVAAAQLYNVDTISIPPNFSWRLNNAVTAATGGVDLTNNGTVTFDGADNPSLTDYSAGGGSWIAACMI